MERKKKQTRRSWISDIRETMNNWGFQEDSGWIERLCDWGSENAKILRI